LRLDATASSVCAAAVEPVAPGKNWHPESIRTVAAIVARRARGRARMPRA
jgi:hypothetical protein